MLTQTMTPKKAQLLSYAIDMCFLVIHVALMAVFSIYGIAPMVRFNVFSIIFYLSAPVLVHNEYLRAFAVLTYFEVVAHMSAAVYFLGWECGFQITLVGMNVLVFYSEYVGRSLGYKHLKAAVLCAVGMTAYLAAYIISYYNPAPYLLPDAVRFWMEIAWGVIVFVIVVTFLQIFVLITSRSEKILSNEVLHDKLTGLPNRYYMADYFNKVMNVHGPKRYWVAIADLDDFKLINDTYGHNCGDYVLKTVAKLLDEHSVGAEVCRWGGEEFLISDWTAENAQGVTVEMLDHIRRVIETYSFNYEGQPLRMTITIGAAWYEMGQTPADWIDAADKRLYEGKTSGKNKVVM